MTRPNVTPTAEELFAALRPFSEQDSDDTGWALLLWCEAMVGDGRLDDLEQIGRDGPDGPGWSAMLDVNRCPAWALPWLAQFVGVRTLPSASDEAGRRAAIAAMPRWARGTPAALIAFVQTYLRGTQSVTLAERDTSPYHLTITVLAAELAAATYNELQIAYPTVAAFEAAYPHYSDIPSTGRLLDALLSPDVKPAGLQITLVVA